MALAPRTVKTVVAFGTAMLAATATIFAAAPAIALTTPTSQVCQDSAVVSTQSFYGDSHGGLVALGGGGYRLPGAGENAAVSVIRPCDASSAWSSTAIRDGWFTFTTNPTELFETATSTTIGMDMTGTPASAGWGVKALDLATGTALTLATGPALFWSASNPTVQQTQHYEFTATAQQAADIRAGNLVIWLSGVGNMSASPGPDVVYFTVDHWTQATPTPTPSASSSSSSSSSSSASSSQVSSSASEASSAASSLATTGTNVDGILLAAFAVLALGAVAFVAVRRRENSSK